MRSVLTFLTIITLLPAAAQIGTGQWRLHIPARQAIDVVSDGQRIFGLYTSGVLEYDPSDGETSVWDRVNSLSDMNISCGAYHSGSSSVFIGYENGNLDKIHDNKVMNIPAIKLAQIQGSKKINKIVGHGGFVYCATDFAIVVVNPSKNEIKDTYYPTLTTEPILDLVFKGDSIFALTEKEVLRGSLNNTALADPMQWSHDNRFPNPGSNSYGDLEFISDYFYVSLINPAYGADTVFQINDSEYNRLSSTDFSHEIKSLTTIDGRITENLDGAVIIYDNSPNYYLVINNYPFSGGVNSNMASSLNGAYYVADNSQGLVKVESGSTQKIELNGPPKDLFFSMDAHQGQLLVFSGGFSGSNMTFNPGGFYKFDEEKWRVFDRDNSPKWTGQLIWDFTSGSINPTNPDVCAVGSYSNVPLTIYNTSSLTQDTFTYHNSNLEQTSLGNNATAITDLQYDEQGNLWIANGLSNAPLKVMTAGGDWYAPAMPASIKSKMTGKMVIDYNGNKWFTVSGVGLMGFKDNGTISNLSDDSYVLINDGSGSGALPANNVTAIASDFDNEIWIGTENGFAILYNSDGAFDAGPGDYNTQRIKLEYEGNVEYLLGNSYVSDIEVDGGNRKWMGTFGSGIFLLSADGQTILEEWNMSNSPLISNNIMDLQLNQTTGELYIITDLGLISYRTDATYEDPDYANVITFPNPVRPDFEGPVTIQGIKYDSDVKITDAAGNVVFRTTSNGGTATWDCKTLSGERASTGVYYIWTAANEGKGKKVGKVVVVN